MTIGSTQFLGGAVPDLVSDAFSVGRGENQSNRPYGTDRNSAFSRHFVPGYYHSVPPGQALAATNHLVLGNFFARFLCFIEQPTPLYGEAWIWFYHHHCRRRPSRI